MNRNLLTVEFNEKLESICDGRDFDFISVGLIATSNSYSPILQCFGYESSAKEPFYWLNRPVDGSDRITISLSNDVLTPSTPSSNPLDLMKKRPNPYDISSDTQHNSEVTSFLIEIDSTREIIASADHSSNLQLTFTWKPSTNKCILEIGCTKNENLDMWFEKEILNTSKVGIEIKQS